MSSCDIYNRTIVNFYNHNHPARYLVRAVFVQDPPEDLRKSNFFNFTVEFRGGSDEVLDVENATFLQYINEANGLDLRNGIKYRVIFRYPSGIREQRDLFITLVDAATTKPIRYEGQDDSPKMQRVLLTHETICSRCSQQKSCGNKNEAPSDPVIIERGTLKFFLKCNQNCLKGAGNPKDMRRFTMALSFSDITHDSNSNNIVAMSKKMFVHNNSKHSRKRKKEPGFDTSLGTMNRIFEVFPKVGTCGTKIAIFGDGFYDGMQVFFGNAPVISGMVSERLIHVRVPFLTASACQVVVRHGNHMVNAGIFHYDSPVQRQLSCVYPKVGVRGEELIIFGTELPTRDVAIVLNGVTLPTKIMERIGVMAIIPRNVPLGTAEISVFLSNHIIFWFSYLIQDRHQPGFSQSLGFLTLSSKRQAPALVPDEGGLNEIRLVYLPGDYPDSVNVSPSSSNSCTSLSPYTQSSAYYSAPSSSPEMAPMS